MAEGGERKRAQSLKTRTLAARLYLPPWACRFTTSECAVLTVIAIGGADTLATIAEGADVSTKTARRAIALGLDIGVLGSDDAGLHLLHGDVIDG